MLIREMLKEVAGDFTLHTAERLSSGLNFFSLSPGRCGAAGPEAARQSWIGNSDQLQRQFSNLPTVIMTLTSDSELAAQAVRLGAHDYLVKGEVNSEPLRRALVYSMERKQSEMAILKAKEEWELTFDSVPDLIAILDCRHRIVRANKAMAELLGLSPEQCVGLHCYEAIHGLGVPPGFCPHSLTCQDGKEHIADVHEPRLGGDFLVSTTSIHDKQGLITGSIHVARDITTRKQAEEDLLRLNRELRALTDCNQAIVRSADEKRLFTDVCCIMCKIVGYRMAWIGAVEYDEAKSVGL